MIQTTRRALLGGGLALMSGSAARLAAATPSDADEVVPLWPGTPPGGDGLRLTEKTEDQSRDPAHRNRALTGIATPSLVVHRAPRPNGTAMLIIPGGGYEFLSYDNEGLEQAAWLNAQGVTAFVLRYRLPGEGWHDRSDVPLQDAQRAMRLIRAAAAHFEIRPDRVAALGFSAGGHLAGMLATRHAAKVYDPIDEADSFSARPDLAGLLYPVVTMEALTHGGSRNNLLGTHPTEAERRLYSVDMQVDDRTPPIFIACSGDDDTVPPGNSLLLYQAMLAGKRSAELHMFEEGGHGFGVRLPKTLPASQWPMLFTAFGRRKRVLI